MTKTKNYRIERGREKIMIPHLAGELAVAYPFYGPNDSRNLRALIRKDGLIEPTSAEVTSFAHSVYKGDEPEFQEATNIMEDNYFRAFTGILYDPNTKLAHFVDYPEFNEDSYVDRGNLVRRVNSNEKGIRTVPFEFVKKGVRTPEELAKDKYVIAWVGSEEGAEKVAKLVERHPRKEGYVFVPNVSDLTESEARVAGLLSGYDGDRLLVDGDALGYLRGSFSFGVFENADAIGTRKN